METKPKIKKLLSPIDKNIELTSYIILMVLWVLTIITYFNLPDNIPIHYNASGVPDNFGKKSTIIMLPIIGTILFLLLTYLDKHPRIFNKSTAFIGENTEYEYIYATRVIRLLKLAIVIIFSLIVLFTYLTAVGKTKGLGSWFLPFIICILMIPTIYLILKTFKKK